jgi:two-component system chemotaxis sensor kinase CheA
MDIVGEIVITESMVTACPDLADVKSDSFTKSARQLRKLTDDLQDTAMSLRMVSVSSTFQKMTRIVRDMSQKLNKKAKLVTIGADTEMDKTIVDSIGDPIMHMVRNSMDHGIEETVEERILAGKPEEGTVTLSAQHTGSEVIITIADDGKGVSSEGVLAKAKKNGLLTKPESEYTRKEILNMLLLPGFSTNTEVTEFSGRGVGMDVVKKNVEKVGGVVTITSEEGEGMTTTFKIPLTLAIVDGMQISVGDLSFIIPIANINSSFKATESDIVYDEARGEMIRREDEFYPLVRLHEIYDIETETTDLLDGIIIWVESSGDKSFCLFVDELIGEQQVVVKPLPVYLHDYDIKSQGISGCTIMGDGNISIILDPLNLYDSVMTTVY